MESLFQPEPDPPRPDTSDPDPVPGEHVLFATPPPEPSRGWRERIADLWRQVVDGWRRTPRPVRIAGLAAVGLIVFAVGAWEGYGYFVCPDVKRLSSYRPGGAPVLLDRDGHPFGDLAPVEGEMVALASLPPHVSDAFVAVEDQRFREHGAVDPRRVVGALRANLRARRMEQGFSTITMQLARNVFPDDLPGSRRTLARKVLEVRVAQEIEGRFGKDEILEMYLNHIYFGHGARGVEAAARHYFGIPARALGVAQAALLAALPKAPSHYDPRRHPQEARARRDLVLTLMEQQGRLSPEAAQQARAQALGVVPQSNAAPTRAPFAAWYVEEVRRELEETIGSDVYDEKLRITTTLDAGMQRAAEEELARQLQAIEAGALGRFGGPRYSPSLEIADEETPYLQGALVALDARTGDVLAWVGGRDFRHSRFDRVRSSERQAGSAFKPFVYAAALDSGRTLGQPVMDEPLRIPMDRRRVWEPKNFDERFEGPISVRDALVRSKNVPTVRLATDVGFSQVADLAERAGLPKPVPREPSMALGTVSVSPLELAAAYTTFAGLGERVAPRLVLKVERSNGDVLWTAPEPERTRVLATPVAYLITDALHEALVRGTGATVSQAGFHAPAAGKTGTTNDGADAWFVGYTPRMVAAVWIGFDRKRPIMDKATGGRLAAPVWARMMMRAGQAGGDWPRPSDVVEGWIDPTTGSLLVPGCRPYAGVARRELFARSAMPGSVCPSTGEPEPLGIDASYEPPDYEEGMQTGLTDADLPVRDGPPEPHPAESDAHFYVPSTPPEPDPQQAEPPEPPPTPPPR